MDRNLIYSILTNSCYPTEIFKQQKIAQELFCTICLQIMKSPVCEVVNNHTFGRNCLNQAIKQKKLCPMCRAQILQLNKNTILQEKINNLQTRCITKICQWKGRLGGLQNHLSSQCNFFIQQLKTELKSLVQQQIGLLQQKINPHLKSKHNQIYTQYVKNWQWLINDVRDWKWWWWASNPWWQNQVCIDCNDLWHEYEARIDSLELIRVLLIKKLKN